MNYLDLISENLPFLKKELIVRFNYPGFHMWENCPIQDYFYLEHLHRHVFYWEITAKVTDSNREIEFIDLKDKFIDIIKNEWDYKTGRDVETIGKDYDYSININNALYFGSMSCEMIAEKTKKLIDNEIDIHITSVSVFEDNENGAKLTWA